MADSALFFSRGLKLKMKWHRVLYFIISIVWNILEKHKNSILNFWKPNFYSYHWSDHRLTDRLAMRYPINYCSLRGWGSAPDVSISCYAVTLYTLPLISPIFYGPVTMYNGFSDRFRNCVYHSTCTTYRYNVITMDMARV